MTDLMMFSIVETQLDIIFTIAIAAQFAKNTNHVYTKAV